MKFLQDGPSLSRRGALRMGAGVTGGLLTAAFGRRLAFAGDNRSWGDGDDQDRGGDNNTVPSPDVRQKIESILQAQGQVSNGVFSVEIDRKDITDVTLHGVPITPSFQINGTVVYQTIRNGQIMMNADMALKANEIDPFIDALINHGIVFQAEHQHFYDFTPLVWFIHFRAMGDPETVTWGVKAALNKTSTPFPQTPPSNPSSPLPAAEIGRIIGARPQVGGGGVVMLQVPRAEPIMLGGVHINPYLNVETPIAFEPLPGGQAAAVPDFGMIASEINNVVGTMRRQGWDTGCLYNQETDEHPQLYFSHNFKTGDPLQLAREIRNGLNRMNVKLM